MSRINNIASEIEERVNQGCYLHADDESNETLKGKRKRLQTNHYINESARETKVKSSSNRQKKTKQITKTTPTKKRKNILESDEEDEDDSTVRKAHINRLKRNRIENMMMKNVFDDDLSLEPSPRSGNDLTPVEKGGTVFNVKTQLDYDSESDGEEKNNIRMRLERSRKVSQQAKLQHHFDELKALREDDCFDDEASEGGEVNTSVNGNNNVINITNNHIVTNPPQNNLPYQYYNQPPMMLQDQYMNPRFQQTSYPFPEQTPMYHHPSFQNGYHNYMRGQIQYQSFPLLQQSAAADPQTIETPVRLRLNEANIRLLIQRYRMENTVDRDWLNNYERILNSKLNGMVTGRALSTSDQYWINNNKRSDRRMRLTSIQEDLLFRLIELRIN